MQTSSHSYCCKWHRKECRKNAFIYVGIYVCVSYLPASFAQLILSSKATFTFQFIFLFSFNIYFSFLCVYLPYALQQQTRMYLADIHTHTQIFSIHSCMHFAAFFAPLSAAAISRSPLLPIVQAIT